MKSIVRVLAFATGILALLLVVFVFMIDGIIENQIEKYGTKAVGARVDLAAADLSFFPLGLTLSGLDVTDPAAPMTNAVSVKQISFALDVMPLLKKEVIVEQMAMTGIRLDTPRKASGAVPGVAPPPAKEAGGCKGMSLPPLSMPDVKDILSKEKLLSSEYVQQLSARITAEKDRQQKLLDTLPDQQTFDQYRQRIEKLTGGGAKAGFGALLGAPNEIQSIQKDIEKDLQSLNSAQQQVQQEVSRLQEDIQKTSSQIAADVSRLASKYALSGDGLKNMSKALFGDAYCGWVTKAIDWYERFKGPAKGKTSKDQDSAPPADGGSGVFVWVKNTAASMELAKGTIDGTVKNISNQPARVGAPMTMAFNGRDVGGITHLGLNGLLDLATAGKTKMDLSGKISGLKLTDYQIPGTAGLPVMLSKAMADIDFTADMMDDAIKTTATASMADVAISTGKPAEGDILAKALSSALASVSKFSATADARGTLSDYTVSIRSDMDQMLSQSLSNVVADQTASLKAQLNQRITADVSGQSAQAKGQLAGFDGIQAEIEKRLNIGGGLLKKGGLPF
ncbi:MAG: TIGR03545 family protein [Pseudomonadota bacterium]